MNWEGDKYIAEMERTVAQRVQAAGIYLQSRIRENISVPSRTVTFRTIERGKNRGESKKVLGPRGSNRSKPGDFPHKDFGFLRQSIAQQFDAVNLISRVGSSIKYAR